MDICPLMFSINYPFSPPMLLLDPFPINIPLVVLLPVFLLAICYNFYCSANVLLHF